MYAVESPRAVVANELLVEVSIVSSGNGTVLPCVNWANKALADFNVTLLRPEPYTHAALASGGALTVSTDRMAFSFALSDTADAVILR